jgi:pimeloyl-ACP methyl ester carboxylesterase
MDPAVLDTEVFAPVPRLARHVWAEASRPGVRVLRTPRTLIRVRDTGGPGPTAVLITDAPHTVEAYDDVAAALTGVRLVVLEPPGFGFSWATDPAALAFPGAVAAVVDALRQLEISDAVLGGACVYGFLALAASNAEPGLARALLLAQTPSWEAGVRWGRAVLDPQGRLSVPWEGQVGWRLVREQAADGWYRYAAGPGAPVERWARVARDGLQAGASYALASQVQTWWTQDPPELPPVHLPAVVLWGEADRSHTKAGTDPEQLLDLLPQGRVVRVPDAGHFVDTEDPATAADQLRRLVSG